MKLKLKQKQHCKQSLKITEKANTFFTMTLFLQPHTVECDRRKLQIVCPEPVSNLTGNSGGKAFRISTQTIRKK
jgi:hypothetical protein